MEITKRLFELQDLQYKAFQCKLMPTVDPNTVLGVRTPALRQLAKELYRSGEYAAFLQQLPHRYYEENNLHGFLIGQIKDFDLCIKELERFLPHVDNWATCDSLRPVCFKANTAKLHGPIERWLCAPHPYTVRFGIEMLMTHYLEESFDQKHLERLSRIQSNAYYINMMLAWYFATALAKQWNATLPYIEQHRLPIWVHNKTIQKATESYRITPEQKEYLRTLKI